MAALRAGSSCPAVALQLRGKGVTAVVVHPGWVRTDMGGSSAALDPTESVAAMRRTIADLSLSDSGGFLNYDGGEIPW